MCLDCHFVVMVLLCVRGIMLTFEFIWPLIDSMICYRMFWSIAGFFSQFWGLNLQIEVFYKLQFAKAEG
ncbi:hypothetical protein HanXRQr2_Chr04g0166381 [Helianthus annuus]|uniref:Uncharacterized protein n=1 Tax=Helianthus annuus TaxID=4232 RepID=A0A251TKT0_HELAN|nr:hypothetical protein HanXRQr2_Chr04g0166381 [Helianthus annuus]KAJ0931304.1 hypothetical protein HanPSC8_Chr04g0160051 [Helianthus annuus]